MEIPLYINPFSSDDAKSKIVKFSKITSWAKSKNKQHSIKALFNGFPMNGHNLAFSPYKQKLENFASPKVSLWELKG